jgi:hypothetical protein
MREYLGITKRTHLVGHLTKKTEHTPMQEMDAMPNTEPLPTKLRSERINDFQKPKLIKIRIAGADPSNAMLTHEDCRMRVMQEITGEMRQFQNDLPGDVGMPVGGNQNGESWRTKESRYELPRR